MFLVTLQVMNIYSSYNTLLERPWIHAVGIIVSSLYQCLKYIMNEVLIIIKVEKIVSMIKNVIIPFIEVKDYRYGNIHAFEIMNIEWVLKGAVLRKPKVLEAARMVSIFFFEAWGSFPV